MERCPCINNPIAIPFEVSSLYVGSSPSCYSFLSMTNFQKLQAQLNQYVIPIFCDKYFHLTEVLPRCLGRYLTGSDVDGTLTEVEVFQKKVPLPVLIIWPGHYRICLKYLELFICLLGKRSARPNNKTPLWFSI